MQYGSRNIHRDLIEASECICKYRVAHPMCEKGLHSVWSPQRRCYKTGKPSMVAPNRLQWQLTVSEQDQAWVADITYLRTAEGWLYLAVVLNVYLHVVLVWSMKSTSARELALDPLLIAIWCRQPTQIGMNLYSSGSPGPK